MSSTNKTANLKLNSWIGTDKPKRTDFNNDNNILDSVISSHTGNAELHASAEEKAKWNAPYFVSTFQGNGAASRTIETACPFTPGFGLVFAAGKLPTMNDYTNKAHYNYMGLFSSKGSVNGITLSGTQLTVVQSATAVFGNEYRNFNETGVTYVYILFR